MGKRKAAASTTTADKAPVSATAAPAARAPSTAAPSKPTGKARAKAAVKSAGRAAKATGKAVGAGAKIAARSVVPVPQVAATRALIKNRGAVAAEIKGAASAVRAGAPGAKMAAVRTAGKVAGPLASFIMPALAGAALITTARDAMARGTGVGDAVGSGAYEAGDLVLGGALREFDRRRAAGESRIGAMTAAALTGIDNRFLFGMAQKVVSTLTTRKPLEGQQLPRDLMAGGDAETGRVGTDATVRAIVDYETRAAGRNDRINEAGPATADPSLGRQGRLSPEQQSSFAIRNAAYAAKVRDAAGERQKAEGQAEGSGDKRRGWANPAVQRASQVARGVENFTDWTDEAKNYEPKSA